jgi:hypothetical protein
MPSLIRAFIPCRLSIYSGFWILDFPGLGPKFLVMIMVMIPAVSAGIWHMAYHYIIYMP